MASWSTLIFGLSVVDPAFSLTQTSPSIVELERDARFGEAELGPFFQACPDWWCSQNRTFTISGLLDTLQEHAKFPADSRRLTCTIPKDYKYASNEIGLLSVARTGSLSLHRALRQAQPHSPGIVHDHGCTLADLVSRGATRVFFAIRDPESRLVSGYLTPWSENNFGMWAFNKMDPHEGLNAFVEAWRRIDHPNHTLALELLWSPNRFLWPIVDYYLPGGLDGYVTQGVDVEILCTCNLDNDVEALSQKWNIQLDTEHEHMEHPFQPPTLTEENAAWLQAVYKRDYDFYLEHCAAKCQ